MSSESPVLSVVVAIVSDTTGPPDARHLEPCLESLLRQKDAPPIEIIVPYLPNVSGISRVRERYPQVKFFEVRNLRLYTGKSGSREHHDEIRARGIAVSSGNVVALIEDHGAAAENWAASLITAHREPVAAVGGAIENGVNRALNWAVYFCDFLRYQQPLPPGDSNIASDANVSYKRSALQSIEGVWKEVFHEHSVNAALRAKSERVVLAPDAVVYQNRLGLTLGLALRERYVWGRSYAATRAGLAGTSQRMFWAVFSPALPVLMLARMTMMAYKKRSTVGPFISAFPLTAALIVSWSWGELIGYLTARSKAAQAIARGSHVGF
jgi:hypothetical protein